MNEAKSETLKKVSSRSISRGFIFCLFISAVLSGGCDSVRFAPSEAQKQNAWLHQRTAAISAETAKAENTSDKLRSLTRLSELQSRAFVSYHGLPKEFPQADTAEDILAKSNWELAQTAQAKSTERPQVFQAADNIFELAIGISALLGGVYGTKAAQFLKKAKAKSKALQEIVTGNELFKKQFAEAASAFKQAHKDQSPQTRQIVTEMKNPAL